MATDYALKEGTGEGVNYLLCHTGSTIGDLRLSVETWLKSKDVKGKFDIQHGVAVARSIGTAAGLLSGNHWIDAQLDSIALTIYDVVQRVIAWYKETDKNKKALLKKDIEKTILEDIFSGFEVIVRNNGGQFSTKLTWLDIFFVGAVEVIEYYLGVGVIAQKYPYLGKLIKTIKELPEIKEYIEKKRS